MRPTILFKSLLATFLCIQDTVFIFASLQPGSQCKVAVKKVGCYKDDFSPRPLPELLLTDRDPLSPKFSGKLSNWTSWNEYIEDLVCRCAKQTKIKKYNFFGIQFYGECWSGPNATFNSAQKSLRCVGENYSSCDVASSSVCVGRDRVNFVYRVEESIAKNFQKVGCLCQKIQNQLPRSRQIYDAISLLDWNHWDQHLKSLAAECQKRAAQMGYSYFALQRFAQCWSGPDDAKLVSGTMSSKCCLGKATDPCTANDAICVGKPDSAFVFRRQ